MKILHDKAKFKQYLYTNSDQQKVLEEKLQPTEAKHIHENVRNNLKPTKPKQGKHTHTHIHPYTTISTTSNNNKITGIKKNH